MLMSPRTQYGEVLTKLQKQVWAVDSVDNDQEPPESAGYSPSFLPDSKESPVEQGRVVAADDESSVQGLDEATNMCGLDRILARPFMPTWETSF